MSFTNTINHNMFFSTVEYLLKSLSVNSFISEIDILNSFLDKLNELIPESEAATIYRVVDSKLMPIKTIGYNINYLKKLNLTTHDFSYEFNINTHKEIFCYNAYRAEKNLIQNNCINIPNKAFKGFYSIYAPIFVNKYVQYFVSFDSFSKPFSPDSEKLLCFFAKIFTTYHPQLLMGIPLHNFNYNITETLVSAIEIKDSYTSGHAKRVCDYCKLVATQLKFSNKRTETLVIAALLHDIGKIGISETILNKPGSLTEEEFSHIKLHPEYSKKIIDNIDGFEEISKIIYAHHERVDGFGYPSGLSSNEIPLESYIIMVCDAFDAMTSERCYKKAVSKEEAKRILKSESNSQFHPQIVDIFCKISV